MDRERSATLDVKRWTCVAVMLAGFIHYQRIYERPALLVRMPSERLRCGTIRLQPAAVGRFKPTRYRNSIQACLFIVSY
jgi:hypothetical protein